MIDFFASRGRRVFFARLRVRMALLLASMFAVLVCAPALAADAFPSRAIHIVVPFPPGGSADILARIVGQQLSEQLGQSVLIENRPGGGTVIGTTTAMRSVPDGYTLLVVSNSFLINSSLRAKPPYQAHRDFVPVGQLVRSPQVIVVQQASPMKTLADLYAAARARNGALVWGTVGPATSQQIIGESLKSAVGLQMTYVSFPGGVTAVNALLGGHVEMVLANLSEVAPHVTSGSLRALAVTSARRIAALPDVPAVAETEPKDFDFEVWFGLVAPKGTPAATVESLNAQIARALAVQGVREKLITAGFVPAPSRADEFARQLQAADVLMTSAGRRAGVTIE